MIYHWLYDPGWWPDSLLIATSYPLRHGKTDGIVDNETIHKFLKLLRRLTLKAESDLIVVNVFYRCWKTGHMAEETNMFSIFLCNTLLYHVADNDGSSLDVGKTTFMDTLLCNVKKYTFSTSDFIYSLLL